MKTGAILVLMAFVSVGVELTCAWRPPFRGEDAKGILPQEQRRPRAQLPTQERFGTEAGSVSAIEWRLGIQQTCFL